MKKTMYFDKSTNTTYATVEDLRVVYPNLPKSPTVAQLEAVRVAVVESDTSFDSTPVQEESFGLTPAMFV